MDIIRNVAFSVGTTNIIIAPQLLEGQRDVLVITNTSTGGQVITIQTGDTANVVGAGIILYPAGSWSESTDSAFRPSNLEYWAISSGAGGTLAIQERIKR